MPKYATVEEYFASLPETLRAIAELLLPIVDGQLPAPGPSGTATLPGVWATRR
ncbi:MAG TPA: hypothetical protein VGD71_22875 [Kribbella sp.]